MTNVPDIVREYLQRDHRTFYARLLYNGEPISGEVRDGSKLYKGSCGSGNFQPQCIFSNYADISLDYCTDNLTGKKLELEYGVKIDGVEYWFKEATLYASKPSKKADTTTFQALGTMSAKLGRKFTGGSFSTVSSLLAHIETVAGASVSLSEGLEDLAIPEDADLSKYLYREVVGLVAGLYFGYATEDVDGNIIICTYNKSGGVIDASLDRMLDYPTFQDEATVVGVDVVAKDNTQFTAGDLQNCSITNPLMTQEAFDKYANNYVGYTYTPYDMELSLGDFTLEPWDCVKITDDKGVEHTVPCMSICHSFDGGLKTTISAPTLEDSENYRGETSKNAGTAYDAFVSGNFGGSGGGEVVEGINNYEIFEISGDNVKSGIGWIDSGGGQAFASINLTVPSVFENSACKYTGTLYMQTYRDLRPYKTYDTKYLYLDVPVFWYDGTEYYSAGAIHTYIEFNLNSMTYTVNMSYSNNYMEQELGTLYTYDSDTMTYVSHLQMTYQVNISWLLNAIVS